MRDSLYHAIKRAHSSRGTFRLGGFTMSLFLTSKEVAARLRVSRATAARLIAEGVIPVVVLADRPRRRLVRIREDALEQYVRDCERGGSGERGVA